MTWREFVTEVERKMKEKDIPDDTPIAYMDFSGNDPVEPWIWEEDFCGRHIFHGLVV